MLDIKKLKNSLTPEQVTAIVCALGSVPPLAERNALRFTTVCHHGDSQKLYYFLDTKEFHCYTHCNENFDIFDLVQRSKGFDSFADAFRWTVDQLKIGLEGYESDESPELETADDWDLFDRKKAYDKAIVPAQGPSAPQPQEALPDSILNYWYPGTPKEWLDDGISWQAMRFFGIRVDPAKQRIIIPHRDKDGKLIGIRCRNFDPVALETAGKYMPVTMEGQMFNHQLGRNLFGLWENRETIRSLRKVLVCESEKSVMQCASMYGIDRNFCVATCGHNLSAAQADLLLNMGVTEIIIGYDHDVDLVRGKPDEQTARFEQEMLDIAQPYAQYFNVELIVDYGNVLGHKHSPTDDGRDKLEALMKSKVRIPSVRWDGREAKHN